MLLYIYVRWVRSTAVFILWDVSTGHFTRFRRVMDVIFTSSVDMCRGRRECIDCFILEKSCFVILLREYVIKNTDNVVYWDKLCERNSWVMKIFKKTINIMYLMLIISDDIIDLLTIYILNNRIIVELDILGYSTQFI